MLAAYAETAAAVLPPGLLPPELEDGRRELDAQEVAIMHLGAEKVRQLAKRGISVVAISKAPAEARSFAGCLETVYEVDHNGRHLSLRYLDLMSL